MIKHLTTSIRITIILLLIVCGAYPLVVWAIGQSMFRNQANGSMAVDAGGHVVGSTLLAQGFTRPEYFHPRPSAAGNGYDPTASGGTNLGPTSDKLINGEKGFDGVRQLADAYRRENNLPANAEVPVDAVTRSASGLDPDIGIANARLQAGRIAMARHIDVRQVDEVIARNTEGRLLGLWGEQRVNVLRVNLALDKEYPLAKQ